LTYYDHDSVKSIFLKLLANKQYVLIVITNVAELLFHLMGKAEKLIGFAGVSSSRRYMLSLIPISAEKDTFS
jgi:hypothetical protein